MLVNGKRALAYVQKVHDIRPIEGADRIELVHVLGWTLIAKKGEFKEGDKAVYIEIDSRVPEIEQFEFLRDKKFKVATYKLNKFKTISQGLALPLSSFPNLGDLEVDTDVTELLGITYASLEDTSRKSSTQEVAMQSLRSRRKKLFNNKIIKWLMRRAWGRKVVFKLFGRKKDKPLGFPTHLTSKTDEERIENLPYLLGTGPWVATEKIDGSSVTFILEKKNKRKFEFYVCSRNLRQKTRDQKGWYEKNIYWEMSDKYDMENKMRKMFVDKECNKTLVIQGEVVGPSVQSKTYGLKERDLFMFNVKIDQVRLNPFESEEVLSEYSIKNVPVMGLVDKLPETMKEMKELAEGPSLIGEGIREGSVYRSLDGTKSFKNVSLSYLLEKHK